MGQDQLCEHDPQLHPACIGYIEELYVTRGTTEELETTLDRCAADVAEHGIEPPAIVVVGAVVRLRAGLDWLGALTGRVLDADPLGRAAR